MEKDFYYIELFDLYKGLLTETQRETFSAHYLLDLSFAEIAEEQSSTRQSVSGAIKKVKEKLCEYEKLLRVHEMQQSVINIAERLSDKNLAEKLKEAVIK